MSYLKFGSNQFLEKQELDRLWEFLYDSGFKKHLLDSSYSYGIIKEKEDTNFDNFRVKEGTNNGTVKIDRDSYALDEDGNLIYKQIEDNINVTDDDNWYWIKISHKFSPIEKGVVEIDSNGNLTGTGTKFTEVLRGGTNVPSVIAFTNSSNNIQEYTVLEVIDNDNAVLSGASGTFTSETGLNYKIIGSFTPDYSPSSSQKDIFQYDSVNFEFILEPFPQNGQPPSKVDNKEFWIARVKRNGNSLIIEDKRNEFWRLKAGYELFKDLVSDNPLVGVEAVKWDSKYSTRDKNIVEVGWGFRTTNFSWNSSLNKISISGGFGGKFKGVADFTTGDFDGWRIYFTDGSYSIINTSSTNGSQIDLILDNFDPAKISSGDEINIVPDVEGIEFYIQETSGETNNGLVDRHFEFNIEEAFAKLYLLVPDNGGSTYNYNLKYRYKNFGQYSQWTNIPDDTTNGFPSENKHDEFGFLINPNSYTSSTSSNGNFTLTAHPSSYYSRINTIDTGDKFGVNTRNLDNANPLIDLEIGVNDLYQIIDGQSITFNTNHYVNLLTTNTQEYNRFILDFRGLDISKSNNEYYITQDFDGSGVPSKDQAELEVTNVDGDSFTIEVQVNPYNKWITIGSYEVQPNDSSSDVANGLVSNGNQNGINDQNLYGYGGVSSGSIIDITEEPPSDLLYTKYDTEVQIVYNGTQGTTNINVNNNFQGGEILFSLSNFWIYQMSKTDCCFIAYIDNNGNWFLERYQKYYDQEYGGTPNITSNGEIIIPNKGTLFDLGSNSVSPLIGIISDYHHEGDEITFYSGGLYEDSGLHSLSGNIANLRVITDSRQIQTAYFITFQKINNLWYLKGCFQELEDRIVSLENPELWKDASNYAVSGYEGNWGDNSLNDVDDPKFRKDSQGRVYLSGVAEATQQADNGTTIFTLPNGYKPNNELSFVNRDVATSDSEICSISVNPDGTVVGLFGANALDFRVKLEQVSFFTDQ